MNKEDKDLLLKDLCARLPYGVKVKTSFINEPLGVKYVNPSDERFAVGNQFTLVSNLDFDTFECKPYLFPLSSMTEEQKIIYGDYCYEIIHSIAWDGQFRSNELYNWLLKNHFDIYGLIPMDLAIDATGLNIY